MNASSYSDEENVPPFSELCPIDLKKKFFILGSFNVKERYQKILSFWEEVLEKGKQKKQFLEWHKKIISKIN